MATLSTVITLEDNYSDALKKITAATEAADKKIKALVGSVDKLNTRLNRIKTSAGAGSGGVSLLASSFIAFSSNASKYVAGINMIIRATSTVANKTQNASTGVGKLKEKISEMKAAAATGTKEFESLGELLSKVFNIENAQKVMDMTDSYVNTSAKLSLINGGKPADSQLQDKAFAAAMRSRGSYTDMASDISKMGTMAKDSFGSNDELITFTELAQKSLVAGGANPEERRTGMDQIVQSMAAGGLQGDGFKSLMETAPLAAEAISKFTGMSSTELMAMSDQGVITADVIKKSIFAMSGEIDDRFRATPMTFTDMFSKVQESATHAFGPVFEKLSGILGPPRLQEALNSVLGAINLIAAGIDAVVGFVQSGWSIIEPILVTVGSAFALWAVNQIPILVTELWAMVEPVLIQAAGWLALNWPILLIGAAIGFLLYAMINFGDATVEMFGYIGGGISVLIALIYNMVAAILNSIVYLGDFVVNLFVDIINSIVDLINLAIEGLNNIPGVDIGLVGKLEQVEGAKLEYRDLGEAFTKGQDIGKFVGSTAVNGVQGLWNQLSDLGKIPAGPDVPGVEKYMKNGALPVSGKDGGNLKVDMNQEDLKYLQDIAEREYINNFSTATLAPNVSISFGNVTKEVDVDNVVRRVGRIMREEIAMVSEGGYVV